MTFPDPATVLDLIEAFRRSKTMFTAVSLGIFERLTSGPAGAAALAQYLNADVGALERLLDACCGLGLLEKNDGEYANTAVTAAYLVTASPRSLHGYIRYSDEALFPMWGHLDDAIREGTHRWSQTFGLEGPLFSHFFRTEAAMRDFLLGMHGLGMISSPRLVETFDLSRFRRMVDLGGATGHLVIATCERYPSLEGAVFDLPRAVEMAREQVALSPARDRLQVIAGDFFTDPLPDADLFALGRVLHDWSDEKIARLLCLICERLPAGGALLIGEKLLLDDKTGPVPATMQSLNMLVVAEGRERSAPEYAGLLRQAGFAEVDARRTGTVLDAILAVKA